MQKLRISMQGARARLGQFVKSAKFRKNYEVGADALIYSACALMVIYSAYSMV